MDENAWPEDVWTGGLAGLIRESNHEETVTVSRRDLDKIELKVQQQDSMIKELVGFNRYVHGQISDLHARMVDLESQEHVAPQETVSGENSIVVGPVPTTPKRDASNVTGFVDFVSPSASPMTPRQRELATRSTRKTTRVYTAGVKKNQRKSLKIEVPGNLYKGNPQVGLPTPLTMTTSHPPARFVTMPETPLTPGQIGPPSGKVKSLTSIHKRGIHNLDKMVPPPNAALPMLPITDTEIIVYFFNSLSRPIVSLRLYANGWGPKEICAVLNSHREIDPPYLRNTCSVKCTTAIKKGRERNGENWEVNNRALFDCAGVDQATDLIRLVDEDAAAATDFNVLDLCIGLKAHPRVGSDGGIFTKCVQYCQDHGSLYKLSNVSELAAVLEAEEREISASTPDSQSYARPDDQFQGSEFEPKDVKFSFSDRSTPRAVSESSASGDSLAGDETDPSSQDSG